MRKYHVRHVWPIYPIVTLSKNGIGGLIEWTADPNSGQQQFTGGGIFNSVMIRVNVDTYMSYGGYEWFYIFIERWGDNTWKPYIADKFIVDSEHYIIRDYREYWISQENLVLNSSELSSLKFRLTVSMDIGGGYSDDGEGYYPREGPKQTCEYSATFKPPSLSIINEYEQTMKNLNVDTKNYTQPKPPKFGVTKH
jgi:hypothetical protein